MAEIVDPEAFGEIVDWAYSTLPPGIRELPDFPGIQVVDEPPKHILKKRTASERRYVGLLQRRTQDRAAA